MNLRVTVLVWLVVVSSAWGQDKTVGTRDVVWKEGLIESINRLEKGKVKIKVKEGLKYETFTLDWQSMVYKLTERNCQIFKENGQGMLADVLKDVNQLRRRQAELPDKELEFLHSIWQRLYVAEYVGRNSYYGDAYYYYGYSRKAAKDLNKAQMAYRKEEDERRNHYGPRIRLVPNLEVVVVAARRSDTTYGVFVTSKIQELREEESMGSTGVREANSKKIEEDAQKKLKIAKALLSDASAAKEDDKERLSSSARTRLEEIVERWPETEAAKEAKKLLKKK